MEEYQLTEKPAMLMIGIACRTSNTPDAGPIDIPQLWAKFLTEDVKSQIPNKATNDVIALYCDYEGDHTQEYTLVIGCPVNTHDEVPRGMIAKIIPKASYAVYQAIGEHPKALIDTWGKVWSTSLPRTFNADFEIYGEKFSASPQEVELCVGVR